MSARLERPTTLPRLASDYSYDGRKRFDDELESIRTRSRSIWSRPDTSLTTHGHFFVDPQQNERTQSRPTSTGRRNNPHPKLVFMRTGMREIPNAYGAPPTPPFREVISRPTTATVEPNYWEQMPDLTAVERQGVNAFLKTANENSKMRVVEAVRNYRTMMSNEYECPPIGASMVNREDGSRTEFYPSMEQFRQANRNDKEITAINEALDHPNAEVKVVDESQPQPALQRTGRFHNRPPKVHFQRRSHSHHTCPWPLAKQPYRGDYSIHSDWHPRLPHHRLTCLC